MNRFSFALKKLEKYGLSRGLESDKIAASKEKKTESGVMMDDMDLGAIPVENADTEVASVRRPPQSIESEQSVLGGLLLDNNAFDLVATSSARTTSTGTITASSTKRFSRCARPVSPPTS